MGSDAARDGEAKYSPLWPLATLAAGLVGAGVVLGDGRGADSVTQHTRGGGVGAGGDGTV